MQDTSAGSRKEDWLQEENGIANMKYKPFTSKHCMPSRFTSPLMQTDAVEKTKKVGKFAAKQGVKQALKAFGQKAVSTAFGVGGMLPVLSLYSIQVSIYSSSSLNIFAYSSGQCCLLLSDEFNFL